MSSRIVFPRRDNCRHPDCALPPIQQTAPLLYLAKRLAKDHLQVREYVSRVFVGSAANCSGRLLGCFEGLPRSVFGLAHSLALRNRPFGLDMGGIKHAKTRAPRLIDHTLSFGFRVLLNTNCILRRRLADCSCSRIGHRLQQSGCLLRSLAQLRRFGPRTLELGARALPPIRNRTLDLFARLLRRNFHLAGQSRSAFQILGQVGPDLHKSHVKPVFIKPKESSEGSARCALDLIFQVG